LTKIVHNYFIILNCLYKFLFWSKNELAYFKFGRKVNRPKREWYVFGRKRPCLYLLWGLKTSNTQQSSMIRIVMVMIHIRALSGLVSVLLVSFSRLSQSTQKKKTLTLSKNIIYIHVCCMIRFFISSI
jgi:hypothetical protein